MAAEERERPGRATEEKARRRRRGDGQLAAAKRLPIPPEVQAELDRKGLIPRWVNDTGNRMHRMTVQDDYDKVEGVEPVPVGTDEAGKPIMAHLLAKPREFWNEDQRAADDKRKAQEEALFRKARAPSELGGNANPQNPTAAPDAEMYVAEGTKLRRNQIAEG